MPNKIKMATKEKSKEDIRKICEQNRLFNSVYKINNRNFTSVYQWKNRFLAILDEYQVGVCEKIFKLKPGMKIGIRV